MLDSEVKNPRKTVWICGPDNVEYSFNFIYYNNELFGGTRNEYRLTGMTGFLRHNDLCEGDILVFKREMDGRRTLEIRRKERSLQHSDQNVIKLTGNWRVIKA